MQGLEAKRQALDTSLLEVLNVNAAGIDLANEEFWVAVPAGRAAEPVQAFGSYTADLRRLADWLTACGIDTVAMESTGVYWVPLYELLERRGFEVYLVNAQHVQNVNGRKTDVVDCQWLQQLHTYGLLRASFRPPAEIAALRALVRHREMLIQYRAAHIQHMQKALDQMNVKLTTVLSDITGATGLKIIRAIVAGERDPHVLAAFRHGGCKKSADEIALALEGTFQPEYLFQLQQALELFDFYGQQLAALDDELEAHYATCEPRPTELAPPELRTHSPRKNQPHFDLQTQLFRLAGVDLTAIDGLDSLSVQTILSEIGTDMSAWPTAKHFGSWLTLAPNHRSSAGKVKSRTTAKSANRAATAFRMAAQSLARSNCALGAFYRRIRARAGAPKAITATAYKLARIVYHMLKHQEPYRDPGVEAYEAAYQERTLRRLKRQAAQLGYTLQPNAP